MYASIRDGHVAAVVAAATPPSVPEGWRKVTTTDRPVDTEDKTWESTVELVDGVPVQVWRPRPWTVRERTVRELRDALTELEVTDRPLPVLTRAVTAAGRLLLDEEDT